VNDKCIVHHFWLPLILVKNESPFLTRHLNKASAENDVLNHTMNYLVQFQNCQVLTRKEDAIVGARLIAMRIAICFHLPAQKHNTRYLLFIVHIWHFGLKKKLSKKL